MRRWLKRNPKKCGFETGSWQMDMVTEMIRKEFGVTVRARTLRRWLRRIGFSWRKDRYVPYRSVSKEGQEEFKREVGERAAQRRADGMAVFAEDEAAVQRSQNPAYGWRPTGGREQVRASFSRESVRIFGAMSQDELRIKIVESTNSEAFREFLEEIRRDRPRLFMVLDNASYHKSKAVREYVESAGGDVELEFLSPYTPQLNPVETVWRDLKKRLAGRFFRSLDELKAAITAILRLDPLLFFKPAHPAFQARFRQTACSASHSNLWFTSPHTMSLMRSYVFSGFRYLSPMIRHVLTLRIACSA